MVVHLHRPVPGAPREWLCGTTMGQATGVAEAVTCPECLAILAAERPAILDEEPHGDDEAVQVPPMQAG